MQLREGLDLRQIARAFAEDLALERLVLQRAIEARALANDARRRICELLLTGVTGLGSFQQILELTDAAVAQLRFRVVADGSAGVLHATTRTSGSHILTEHPGH